MSDIWSACAGPQQVGPLSGTLLRIVENQEQVATRALVDTLAEQSLLESLLDATKPPARDGTQHLHYLLATPFRYPPLRYGSRFGRSSEPSLFYASRTVETLLAEAAYYRLVFREGMRDAPPRPLETQHTVFEARYRTARGVRLQDGAFSAHRARLRDPADYRATQALGTAMREHGVQAFEFPSARDPAGGVNVALFTPQAFAARRPGASEAWLAQTDTDAVQFLSAGSAQVIGFTRSQFLVDGRLPEPAVAEAP